jgi:hypothetical protein
MAGEEGIVETVNVFGTSNFVNFKHVRFAFE